MTRSSISHTAWLVMLCQIALKNTQRWQAAVPDETALFYQHCFDYCRRRLPLYRLISLIPKQPHLWIIEQAFIKGVPQHYALRKRWIEEWAATCIASGTTQLIVLGGGFDALAFQMARRYPQVHCFEIDTPAMHMHKVAAIGQAYGALPDNFHALSADLGNETLQALLQQQATFHSDVPTLVVAEGLTMYLNANEIDGLFQGIRSLCTAKVSILFSAVERHGQPETRWGKEVQKASLALHDEQFAWSLANASMPKFLSDFGFIQKELITYSELQRPWRDEEEMKVIRRQPGEYLVYAETA